MKSTSFGRVEKYVYTFKDDNTKLIEMLQGKALEEIRTFLTSRQI